MKYDPKLREAAEEFKAICKKYDCMAVVLFVSPTHCEFVNNLSPSWSIATIEEGHSVRFRSKKEEFPNIETQKFANLSTMHGVTSVVEWSRSVHEQWSGVLAMLRTKMTILHKTWGAPDATPGDK